MHPLKTVSFISLLITVACAGRKTDDIVPTYTITDGHALRFEIKNENEGMLYLDGGKDSVSFRYVLTRRKVRALKNKSPDYKTVKLYEYILEYQKGAETRYPILEQFKALPGVKKKRTLIYLSHT